MILCEISDYVTSEVRKQSIVINGKMQTPTLTSSSTVGMLGVIGN